MGRPAIDLVGLRFGWLTVIDRTSDSGSAVHVRWRCICDCGAEHIVRGQHLRDGSVMSCGCYGAQAAGQRIGNRMRTHGMYDTVEYQTWCAMKSRCTDPANISYRNYGGRGIRVCDEWLGSFEAFYRHIGPRPSAGYSVDRIDNDGNYEPGNVRWATRDEQRQNTRRAGVKV